MFKIKKFPLSDIFDSCSAVLRKTFTPTPPTPQKIDQKYKIDFFGRKALSALFS